MSPVSTATDATRTLTAEEIQQMEAAGCRAEDWSLVKVSVNFNAARVRDVTFSGKITIGALRESHTLPGGVEHRSGIYRATLHNVTLGHDVLIRNIGRHIANYAIGDRVVIDNVGLLATEGETSFGNGAAVNVVSEVGGRAVPLVDRLSSQLAYILTFYRDREDVQQRLRELIDLHTRENTARTGIVASGAQIVNCGSLMNVRIGESAVINGAARLTSGTVHSTPAAPTKIGDGVIAENFIAAAGSLIDSGARLDHSFIGQGAIIARGFSADHSLIFANSELQHGEACSLFAGPFTTTHHKASLLIAGYFSFSNAGSGANQSNHLYKLGPLHEGVLERGVKTGSSCYVMWPARVGAFSVVLGRHSGRFNTTEFPFSYLFEVEGKTLLVPAANLTTVGPRRDEHKWLQRDRRTDDDKLDLVNSATQSPYTAERMIQAMALLHRLDASATADARFVQHGGVRIQRSRLRKAARIYEIALQRYLGDVLVRRLESVFAELGEFELPAVLLEKLLAHTEAGLGKWVDVAGFYLPQAQLYSLLARLARDEFRTLTDWELAMKSLAARVPDWEWDWVLTAWAHRLDKPAAEIDLDDVTAAIDAWSAATSQSNKLVLRDAESEFSDRSSIAFGLDGDAAVRYADFRAVRGSFEDHAFVQQLQQEGADALQRASLLLERIGRLR